MQDNDAGSIRTGIAQQRLEQVHKSPVLVLDGWIRYYAMEILNCHVESDWSAITFLILL